LAWFLTQRTAWVHHTTIRAIIMGRSVTIPAAKAALLLITVICCAATPAFAQDRLKASEREKATTARKQLASISGSRVICQDGSAGSYPCKRTDMTAFLSVSDLAAGLSSEALSSNDIWGWTDPETGVEYALVGMNSGTSFVDISDPVNPKVVGFLPTHTVASTWRDIKVYADHAFIVSEASAHGMQVFIKRSATWPTGQGTQPAPWVIS
jgi:hypothetical protein